MTTIFFRLYGFIKTPYPWCSAGALHAGAPLLLTTSCVGKGCISILVIVLVKSVLHVLEKVIAKMVISNRKDPHTINQFSKE